MLLISIVVVTFCSSKQEAKNTAPNQPKNIIPLEQFKAILLDMNLVEATFHKRGIKPYNKDSITKYFNETITKHKITQKDYQLAFDYYHNSPEEISKVYEQIMEELSIKKAELQKNGTDSLKNKPIL